MNCQVTVRLLCLKAQLRATWHRTTHPTLRGKGMRLPSRYHMAEQHITAETLTRHVWSKQLMMTDVTWRELTRNVYRLGHDCTATDTLHHGRLTTGITDQKTSRRPTARLVHLSAYMPGLPWFLQHLLQPEAVRRPHVGKTVCEKLTKDLLAHRKWVSKSSA